VKFLSIYKTVERGIPPTQEEMERMGKLVEEWVKAGYLLATEGCLPSAPGSARPAGQRENHRDGRAVCRDQGIDLRDGHPASQLQEARYRIDEKFFGICGRR